MFESRFAIFCTICLSEDFIRLTIEVFYTVTASVVFPASWIIPFDSEPVSFYVFDLADIADRT